jgi:RHS repeat-associated protein
MVTSKIIDNTNQTESNTTYEYDKVGNQTKITTDDTVTYSYYNVFNQLIQQVFTSNGSAVLFTYYTYDSNGNQILERKMTPPSTVVETVQKEYDSNNQLTKVTCREGNASGTIKYTQENTYNYDGQRISKNDNGTTTNYYYQGGVLLYTTDEDGNKTSQNIIGPQENVIATIRYEDDVQHAYFYNKDIRTSVTNVVDESGNGVVSYQYDDYGTTTKYGDIDFYNEVCYTSGVYDELTGFYYLNARYYNPDTNTFITQDSYRGEQDDYGTWNLYAYCGGNPINYVDMSGHKKEWISKKKGTVNKSNTSELRICTDGKVSTAMKESNYYGDKNHGKSDTTSCFGTYVGADKIPYIVVPPSMTSYKYSLGVIVNKKNGNYLYCVVGEVGPEMPVGEVSIYAAWKMKGIKPPKNNVVKKKHKIGNQSQSGSWTIILFERSSPSSKASTKNKKYGWSYKNQKKLRKQIKKQGQKCYTGKGKCLN